MLARRRVLVLLHLLVCLSLLGFVGNAVATVRDEPLKLRCVPAATEEGRAWVVEIDRGHKGNISGFRAHGEGLTIDAAGIQSPTRFTVSANAVRTNYVLTIEYDLDGRPYSQSIRLEDEKRDVSRGSLVPVTDPQVLSSKKPRAPDVNPPLQPRAAKGRAHEPRPDVPDGVTDVAKASRNITVHGRLVYQRPDAVYIGVDNARVEIYDEDITFDQVLATTATDANGYYSATFNWDPCFLCENNPDIYVRFESDNGAAVVESANLEITYSFETGTTNDFTGTDLNRGSDQPSSDQQAFQLLTNITRAWRWLSVRGYSTPKVEVKWPANSISATYYNPTFETIHILPEDEWHEATHVHEYGHHWTNKFGSFSIPTYTDLHCGIFGHCMWCSENDTAAFIEGWADWLSDIITKSFSPASTSTDDAETLHVCFEDGNYNSAYATEGFFAALLRDIEDTGNENDPAFPSDGLQDVLSLGTDEILAVADQDAPLSPSAFLTSFKARYPTVACQLWETGRNNGYDLDTQPPGVVSGLDDESVVAVQCSGFKGNRNIVWNAAADDWSCVGGYSILISASPQLPDAVQDIAAVTEYNTGCISPGDYYFNIRTRDRSGKWSTQFASHPFSISSGIAQFPASTTVSNWLLFGWLVGVGACLLVVRRRPRLSSDD